MAPADLDDGSFDDTCYEIAIILPPQLNLFLHEAREREDVENRHFIE